METKISPKTAIKITCEKCAFVCSKQSDYEKHLMTRKHKMETNGNKWKQNISESIAAADVERNSCNICNKHYKTRSGLWKHMKICSHIKDNNTETVTLIPNHMYDTSSEEIKILTNLVLEMVKSNTELQKQNHELQKQVIHVCNNTSINSHNNHSNNKTFNLHFFLNEQCKDAMNMSDFVNTFELQLADLESVGDLGYVEGISKIIVERLNSMDIYKRPMHCSDAKRETLYIKDEDKWEKEERHNPKLRKAIQTVSFKNMKLVNTWSDTYPESKNSESRMNDRYMKLIKQSTGGNGETAENENKIIRRIAKEIVIEK